MKRILIAAAVLAAGLPSLARSQGAEERREIQVEVRQGGGGGGDCPMCGRTERRRHWRSKRGMRGFRFEGGPGGSMRPPGMGGGGGGGPGMRGFGPMGGGGGFGPMGPGLEFLVMRRGNMLLMAGPELGLSDDQLEKIKDAMRSAKKKVNLLQAEAENISIDLRAGIRDEEANASALKKLVDKKYEKKAQIEKTLIEARAAIDGALTKEQKDNLRELHRKRWNDDEDEEERDDD